MTDDVEVWLDADFLERTRVGTLSHDRGTLRFAYDPVWLKNPQAFALDPDLSLGEGSYFPNAEAGNFRVFDDSAPDRWGQTLMKRREALAAKDEGRKPRTLYAWDFLLGVEDISRQGALRYRRSEEEAFLAHETLPVPPAASLRELEIAAREITARRIDDLKALRQWLKVLVAPGASLGGARPKASFTETNGTLWIAKFPARDDTRDVGAWEALVQQLAARAGIDVPASELRRLTGEYHTFCVQRFDRSGVRRRFYTSAMALLRKDQSEGTSYLELAEFLHAHGAKDHIEADLEQLFRRVAFNVAIGNRDDHLRNHGFLLTATGWRLAPAFDLNPNIDRADHVLNIDESDNRPSLATVVETSEWYVGSKDRGRLIVAEVLHETRRWRQAAQALKIARADVELTASAFAESDDAHD
ncbi:MAG TPA: type II toxin-antitoxin system HipA family toxin [Steroidobacteraceae bacterium]|jgi:serine/threonine-protein kinase HipA|nr:type II toxin-antitoxin system HipA family toxin [Steroidobacteraceae bacterium]